MALWRLQMTKLNLVSVRPIKDKRDGEYLRNNTQGPLISTHMQIQNMNTHHTYMYTHITWIPTERMKHNYNV